RQVEQRGERLTTGQPGRGLHDVGQPARTAVSHPARPSRRTSELPFHHRGIPPRQPAPRRGRLLPRSPRRIGEIARYVAVLALFRHRRPFFSAPRPHRRTAPAQGRLSGLSTRYGAVGGLHRLPPRLVPRQLPRVPAAVLRLALLLPLLFVRHDHEALLPRIAVEQPLTRQLLGVVRIEELPAPLLG